MRVNSKEMVMLFNVDKCKGMHLGVGNEQVGYLTDNKQVEAVVDERDLQIIIQHNSKVSKQCAKVVGTANRILGMIYRIFAYNCIVFV